MSFSLALLWQDPQGPSPGLLPTPQETLVRQKFVPVQAGMDIHSLPLIIVPCDDHIMALRKELITQVQERHQRMAGFQLGSHIVETALVALGPQTVRLSG